MNALDKDPLNLLIAGVGGQGNVMLSQIIGEAMVVEGYLVAVGDTFGASQRGGSVVSHIRMSMDTEYSSIVPRGMAHFILGMEPSETMLVMAEYGNPKTQVLTNPRPLLPPSVISGEATYPDVHELLANIKKYSARLWLVNATDEALEMGNKLYANTILMGALLGTGILPIAIDIIAEILKERFTDPKIYKANMKAIDRGFSLTRDQ